MDNNLKRWKGRMEYKFRFIWNFLRELMILYISLLFSIDTRVYPVDIPLFAVTVLDYVRLI